MADAPNVMKLKKLFNNIGYNKFTSKSSKVFYVYDNDRQKAIETIITKIKGATFKEEFEIKKLPGRASFSSSVGGVVFPQTEYDDLAIGVKPDGKSTGVNTAEHESLSAFYICGKLNKKDTDYSLSNLKQYEKNVSTLIKLDSTYEKASKDWHFSCKEQSEAFFKFFGKSGSGYTICHPTKSSFLDRLYKRARVLLKEVNLNIQGDKWNPGDIWVVNNKELNYNFDLLDSITELNSYLKEKFVNRDIIGISLKKVINKNPKSVIFNKEKTKTPIKFLGYNLGKKSYFDSIDMNLEYSVEGKVQEAVVRAFTGARVSGEIKGVGAAGGKVGATEINKILSEFTSEKIIDDNVTKAKFLNDRNSHFKYMFEKARKSDQRLRNLKDHYDFVAEINRRREPGTGKELSYILSKTQVTELANILDSLNMNDKDKVIRGMISYASSSLDVSSIFLKISN
jgi:hypothetical protein